MKTRAEAMKAIEGGAFDVCVIGGGATGAGCALDAQWRGLRTVLVEGADFASGTSSASTKMVHGGVRYLEQAVRGLDWREFKVVKRALCERIRMLRNAPFLTATKQFVTPCYNWREAAYYQAGLKLYDWIAGKAGLAPSRFLSRDEALRRIPGLNAKGLVGAVAYTDGQFDDARYNMALVQTFAEVGGEALNYACVVGFAWGRDGKIDAAEIEDRVSGRTFAVAARVFINATGPFADTVRRMASPEAETRMRLSRGAHVLLPLDVLASGQTAPGRDTQDFGSSGTDALLVPKTEDGRVLFAIPWMNRLLVGTTDEEVEHAKQRGVTRAEVEYLLRHLNRYLAAEVKSGEVVAGFAGVRPLVTSQAASGLRKRQTKALARDHEVEIDRASGLVSIMGGKWTTYRAMAEDTIDIVEHELGRKLAPCRTARFPLAGSDGFTPEYFRSLVRKFPISQASAKHLAKKFGTRAGRVMELLKEDARLADPVSEAVPVLRAEVVFSVRHEMAASIEDVLARRTGVEFYGWGEAMAAAPAVADLQAKELGWTREERQKRLDQHITRIVRSMRKARGE